MVKGRRPPLPKRKTTLSKKAGITFSVSRVRNGLRKGKYADHIQVGAAVYLAAVLEYLSAEILELGGNGALNSRRKRITPRHLFVAIRADEELHRLLHNVTIAGGGVLPYIHPVLVPVHSKRSSTVEYTE